MPTDTIPMALVAKGIPRGVVDVYVLFARAKEPLSGAEVSAALGRTPKRVGKLMRILRRDGYLEAVVPFRPGRPTLDRRPGLATPAKYRLANSGGLATPS